jgi:uncharacterized membrane protein YgdD (TMEM256/DUF423 family)
MERVWLIAGGLAGLTAVVAAAAVAHAWSPVRPDPQALQQAQSALLMHVLHTPALLAVAGLAARGVRIASLAGVAFAAGLVLFCGAVYAQAGWSLRLPHVAPLGGLLLIAGWLLLTLAGVAGQRRAARKR